MIRRPPRSTRTATLFPYPTLFRSVTAVVACEEASALGLQLPAQLAVVVDAAVEGDRQPHVGVDHRLRRGLGEVDDLQPAVPQGDLAVLPEARAVRASPPPRVGHRSDRRDVRRLLVRSDLSAESAHDVLVYPQRARSSPLEAGQPALGLVGPLAELVEGRSEERRVGKECVSTCRSRWSPYH